MLWDTGTLCGCARGAMMERIRANQFWMETPVAMCQAVEDAEKGSGN
jgi:hypothetical protein